MSITFSTQPQLDEIYRFRSVDALIGSRKELSRQTVYLARPDKLNDLAEDTVNVVWDGDDILWPNLIHYYWRSLLLTAATNRMFLPGYHGIGECGTPLGPFIDQGVAHLEDQHKTQRAKALKELGQSKEPVSGYKMRRILSTLTPRRIQTLSFFDNPSVPETFPDTFVQALGKMLLAEWGVACFTRDFTNPFMWSSYAENNTGVCLVFDKVLLSNVSSPRMSEGVELDDVTYEIIKPEIEFFSSLPGLTVSEYTKLFTDAERKPSAKCPFLPEDSEVIAEANARQRQFARKNLLTKLRPWEMEQEVRMFSLFHLRGMLDADSSVRTIQYPIGALKGIIFGSRMAEEDMQSVLDVILSKHYVSPMRQDFCFWEAELQPNGSIYKRFYTPYLDWREKYTYPSEK